MENFKHLDKTDFEKRYIENSQFNIVSEKKERGFQLPLKEREQKIDIATNTQLKLEFSQVVMPFWIDVTKEYPETSKRAVKYLTSFVSTYVCEKFSFCMLRQKQNTESDWMLKMTLG
ncbi:hypothetical protein TNCV_1173361 [Trichonephila clavipes]|uniref:Uncharacterized protein n=1 Tax=Trichonephila clavipes TaxID=2585209 RepID=A0A8X6SAC2_TRICX|nr:hypothetical protein TNCV_1173361 [Trichonephila clavipes]